jgi:hypothetical protein
MKTLILGYMIFVMTVLSINAQISTELPSNYLGEYSGEPLNVRKESKGRNANILYYADNVIILGSKQSLQWKMTEPVTSGKYHYKGKYGIINEDAESYTLLCTASFSQKNATTTAQFYLIVMKKGAEIKFLEMSKVRSFMLKKK